MLDLAAEWEKHRVPLIEEYRRLLDQQKNRTDVIAVRLEEIKAMRAEMKALVEDIHTKDDAYKQLQEQFSKLPKDNGRSVYTKRILEVVKNVKKQKVDIDKILLDTRSLQKEINRVSESLSRSFAESSEMIFADAEKSKKKKGEDGTSIQAYKDLVMMRESFEKLTVSIAETGKIQTQILNLETKIEQITQRTKDLNVKQVTSDLKDIKAENAALIAKIKGKS